MSAWVSCRAGRLVALLATAGVCGGLVGSADAAPSRPQAGHATLVYSLAGADDKVFPEGVAFDRRSGSFFVGSTGSGAIYQGSLWQRSADVFLPGGDDGRSTATGLKVDRRGRLYVAGGATGYIWVYDTGSRRLIRRFATGTGGLHQRPCRDA